MILHSFQQYFYHMMPENLVGLNKDHNMTFKWRILKICCDFIITILTRDTV